MAQRTTRRARKQHGQGKQTPHASKPWTAGEFSRLLIAARTLPQHHPDDHIRQQALDCRRLAVGCRGIPVREWWPALLLLIADTRCTVTEAVAIPPHWFDARKGTLAAGPFVHSLHSLTIEAFDALRKRHAADNNSGSLLPWTLDGGRPPFHMLYRALRTLLYRAGLPHVTANLFDRLKLTADSPRILDRLDLQQPFEPRRGEPRLGRAPRPSRAQPKPALSLSSIVPVDPARTLRNFFREKYAPVKLATASTIALTGHLASIDRFATFLGREPTFDELRDDLLEDFAAWALQLPRRPITVNNYLTCLLAQWRFAWKRRKVDDLPRDVAKFPVESRVPDAWSQAELVRLLQACAATTGAIGGIPAGLFWPALVLLIYDTGLRLLLVLRPSIAVARSDAGPLPPTVTGRK